MTNRLGKEKTTPLMSLKGVHVHQFITLCVHLWPRIGRSVVCPGPNPSPCYDTASKFAALRMPARWAYKHGRFMTTNGISIVWPRISHQARDHIIPLQARVMAASMRAQTLSAIACTHWALINRESRKSAVQAFPLRCCCLWQNHWRREFN
jgi:hypothetical protein